MNPNVLSNGARTALSTIPPPNNNNRASRIARACKRERVLTDLYVVGNPTVDSQDVSVVAAESLTEKVASIPEALLGAPAWYGLPPARQ